MCETMSSFNNKNSEDINIEIKFISPLSLKTDSPQFMVKVPGGSKLSTIIDKFIDKYGEKYNKEIFDSDRKPYVNFIVSGKFVELNYKMQTGGIVIVYPPIGGG